METSITLKAGAPVGPNAVNRRVKTSGDDWFGQIIQLTLEDSNVGVGPFLVHCTSTLLLSPSIMLIPPSLKTGDEKAP